jgi:carboxypeptidase Q
MTKKSFDPQQIGDERTNQESAHKYDDPTIPLTGKPPSLSKKIWISLLTLLIGISFLVAAIIIGLELTPNNNQQPNDTNSNNTNAIVEKYMENATTIINYMTKGAGRGQGFDWIANVTDTFGPRKSGTPALENAIDYLVDKMKEQNFSNVHKVNATIPYWIRGEESALLIAPNRNKSMTILGLGSTKATPPEGIKAKIVVVQNFEELRMLGNQTVNGTIVVYNNPWVNYGISVRYRSEGAITAAQYGAVAVLIRSAASFSINSPHTGEQDTAISSYSTIPAASITVEDAEMMYRMQKRGQHMEVLLKINSTIDGNRTVHNTIFDLIGTTYPNEIVMVSGHMDSWDVGQGAMDNAAGASLAWQTITTLKALGLTPKRTIRGIFWTAEEEGHVGSTEYYYQTVNNTNNESYVFLMESDEGLFAPMNLAFAGTNTSMNLFEALMPLVSSLNVTSVLPGELGDADMWNKCDGVPGIFLNSIEEGYEKYFAFHHSNGDMPNVYKPEEVDTAGALFTVLAFVMADMDDTLPLSNPTKAGC